MLSPGRHGFGQFSYKNHSVMKTRFGLKSLFSIGRMTDGDGAGFGCHKQTFLKISTGVTRLFGSLAGSNNADLPPSAWCESQLMSVWHERHTPHLPHMSTLDVAAVCRNVKWEHYILASRLLFSDCKNLLQARKRHRALFCLTWCIQLVAYAL